MSSMTSAEGDKQLQLWEELEVLETQAQQWGCIYPIPPVISLYSTWLHVVLH